MELDIDKFKKSNLSIEKYIILLLISEGEELDAISFSTDKYALLKELEEELYIVKLQDSYELRGKGRELFSNSISVSFEQFWEHYHTITHLPKTDKSAAETKWKRLKSKEKEKAIQMVEAYYNSLNDKRYCRKARTYLDNKNFNDEFRIINTVSTVKINEMI